MEHNEFQKFFVDEKYLSLKNSMFGYKNRLHQIKKNYNQFNKKSIKILDIGSGISPVTPDYKKTIFMDLSKDAIDFMKKRGHHAKIGSITSIPEKNQTFDWIFCSEVLEHIEDYNKALSEMRRVLRDNGLILITIPVHMKFWNIDDEFVGHYRRFDPKTFRKDLINSKLKILKEKPIGGKIERFLTVMMVKAFKKSNKKMNSISLLFGKYFNQALYYLVRFEAFFSTKENTSVMLYVCRK